MSTSDGLVENPKVRVYPIVPAVDGDTCSLKTIRDNLRTISDTGGEAFMPFESKVVVNYSVTDHISKNYILMSGSIGLDRSPKSYVNLMMDDVLPNTKDGYTEEEISEKSLTMRELMFYLIDLASDRLEEKLHVSYLYNFPHDGDSRHVGIVNEVSFHRASPEKEKDGYAGVFVFDIKFQHVPYLA